MTSQEFNLETFETAIRQMDKPVIVDFWASWSVPCMMYKERLAILAHNMKDEDAIIGSVNIDDIPELTQRFSIITIPTTLIFYKEQIVKQYIGIQEPDVLLDAVLEMTGKNIKEEPPVEETE